MKWRHDLSINNPELIMTWQDGHQAPVEKRITIDSLMLEGFARQGSGAAREFLRNLMIDQMVEPLLDFVLRELVAREQNEKEKAKLFGPGPLTAEKMAKAVEELVKQKRGG